MNFSHQDILTFLSLQVAVLVAVVGGIVRSESRMTRVETLLERLGERFDALEKRVSEVERELWKGGTK
jgi:hypothetical protein